MASCHEHSLITDPFFVEILRGITLALAAYRYDLAHRSAGSTEAPARRAAVSGLQTRRRLDLVLGCQGYFEDISATCSGRMRRLLSGGPPDDFMYSTVNSDNLAGGRLGHAALCCIQRTSAGCVSWAGTMVNPKWNYAITAMRARCARPASLRHPAFVGYGDYTCEAGYAQMCRLLEQSFRILTACLRAAI
jgi:DNA-binding LacI/PurR family transcriptional regulator